MTVPLVAQPSWLWGQRASCPLIRLLAPPPNRTPPPIRCRISQRRDSCSLHCQPAHVTFLARQEFRAPNLMAQPDRNSSRDNKRNNEPNFNWRGIVLIAIAFGLIGMALLVRNG